jgi:hypothetical protein
MKNKEKQAAYYREWRKSNKGRIASIQRTWSENNKEKLAERARAHYATHKEKVLATKAKWVLANPEKHAAHAAISEALAKGRITRPTSCSICGTACTPHGHHPDYSKRLEVIWVCSPCHNKEHRKELDMDSDKPRKFECREVK